MATCKQCGQTIVWPQPYKSGQRPFASDGVSLHDCPAYKAGGQQPSPAAPKSIQQEAQEFVDAEALKREQGKPNRDAAIQAMHDEKQEVSEGFLKSKQEYNRLYGSFVQVYLRDVALKEKALKLEAIKQGEDYATL